jgi:hypothetical protein
VKQHQNHGVGNDRLNLDARLAAYLTAAAAVGIGAASQAQAAIVGNTTAQAFGINGAVNIDFNHDGQLEFQVEQNSVTIGGVTKDFLQLDKNDVNGAANPLAFDPGPSTTFQASTFPPNATTPNDQNNAAYVISGPQGSYPAALTAGTIIGPSSTFDYQETDNFQASGKWIRANRLIDEDATYIDQVLGGRPASGVQVPFNGPNFVGLGGEVRYVGVQMELNNSGTFNYGWIGIRITNDADATGEVVGYAYDTTGAPIGAGVVPEPNSMLISLLGGALICSRYIRKRVCGR